MSALRKSPVVRRKQAVVFVDRTNHRSQILSSVVYQGLLRCGYSVVRTSVDSYRRPIGDLAVFYGLKDPLLRIYHEYMSAERPVVTIDLGYWGRKLPAPSARLRARLNGYHKVVVNGLQPTFYPERAYSSDRFDRLGVEIRRRPLGAGKHFLLAGMSDKAAWVWGLKFEEWEKSAAAALRAAQRKPEETLPILYRPKPNVHTDRVSKQLGDLFSPGNEDLLPLLDNAYAVVSHHSNVAVEGIASGIPCISPEGIARSVSGSLGDPYNLPILSEGLQRQFLYCCAYAQWTPLEMQSGIVWDYLRRQGELP